MNVNMGIVCLNNLSLNDVNWVTSTGVRGLMLASVEFSMRQESAQNTFRHLNHRLTNVMKFRNTI